jgi:acyl-CoA dehydrogenase
MADTTYLSWPFFDDAHRELARKIDEWAAQQLTELGGEDDVYAACQEIVPRLGDAGWLAYTVPGKYGGANDALDVRSLCLIREALAQRSGVADFAFAMQGLGSGPISLCGIKSLRESYLPRVATGRAIAAFAVSEKEAGSNVAAITTSAARDGNDWVLDGEKSWISNAGIADFYVVLARTGEAGGAKGLSLFVVDADSKGLEVSERIDVISPHALGSLRFTNCRISGAKLVGKAGDGFKVAMATLDVFRSTVGAAALGFARRALDEAAKRSVEREIFDHTLADFQMTQQKIADMSTEIDASALLVYRAAWTKDSGADRITREAAMAKMYATEAAQRVIDHAVQLFGGLGVVSGHPLEVLYRDIRPLRIYEGTTEIQKLVVARETLKNLTGGR